MSEHHVRVTVNGLLREADVPARLTLVDLLRDRLHLTATHVGCEQGVCGACTVLIDGRTARSCLTLAVQVDGASVETLEGVAREGKLHPIQEALWAKHGLQCGFCTPGVIMTTLELLERHPNPTRDETVDALGGVLCRCTGYVKILESVEEAVRLLASREAS